MAASISTGMPVGEVGASVDYEGVAGEIRYGIDHAENLYNPRQPVKAAGGYPFLFHNKAYVML